MDNPMDYSVTFMAKNILMGPNYKTYLSPLSSLGVILVPSFLDHSLFLKLSARIMTSIEMRDGVDKNQNVELDCH